MSLYSARRNIVDSQNSTRYCARILTCVKSSCFLCWEFYSSVLCQSLRSVTLSKVRKNAVSLTANVLQWKSYLLWAILFWSSSHQLEWTSFDSSRILALPSKRSNTLLCPELLFLPTQKCKWMWGEKKSFNLFNYKCTVNVFLVFIWILNLGTQFLAQMSDQWVALAGCTTNNYKILICCRK